MEVKRCRKGGCGKETLGALDLAELRSPPLSEEGHCSACSEPPIAMEPVVPAAGMLTCFHVRPIPELDKQTRFFFDLVLSTRVSEWLTFPSHLPYQ